MTFMDFFQAVGIIATALAALAALWVKVGVPTVKFIKAIKLSFDTLDAIRIQFAPNGGSTLRDAINRIEVRQIIQEQKHKILTMDAPYAIFEADAVGNYKDVNRTYSRWVGRSPAELVGKGWVNIIAPEWRIEVLNAWNSATQQEREFTLKFRLIDTDDETFPVFCTAFPLYDSKKILVGWEGLLYKTEEDVPKEPA